MPTAIFNLVSVWVNDYTPPTTGREIEKSRPLLAVFVPPRLVVGRASLRDLALCGTPFASVGP
jgi:hypothetical protein